MLPAAAIEHYTLDAGRDVSGAVALRRAHAARSKSSRTETRLERVRIVANLRHDALEPLFNEATRASAAWSTHPHGAELLRLWRLGGAARRGAPRRRGRSASSAPEYTFHVENDRVRDRARGGAARRSTSWSRSS